ncbi:MAG: PAS domain S-box protein [Syntrophobacteraceae bacterium]
MRKEVLKQAECRARLLLDENLAMHKYLKEQLQPEILSLVASERSAEYYNPVWMCSTYAVQQIRAGLSDPEQEKHVYKDCAINARSHKNEADEWERGFIEELNRDPQLHVRSAIREIAGIPHLVVIKRGLTAQESCLHCHGAPQAAPRGLVERYGSERSFSRSLGEVVSAASIRIPVSLAYEAANAISFKLSAVLSGMFLALLLFGTFVNDRLFFRPLEALRRKASEISSNRDLIGAEIPLPMGKELGDLTAAFNRMSVALRQERDGLEERVREATAEIRDAHALLRSLMNSSQDLIFVKGTDFRLLACNTAFLEAVGRTEAEILGQDEFQWLRSRLEAERLREWDRRVLEEARAFRMEEAVTRADGTVVHYETIRSPYVNETGRILGVIGVSRDILERRQAEETLRRSEAKFARVFSASPVAMSLTRETDGHFIDVNASFETLSGLGREQILNRSSVDLGFIDAEERARLRGIVARQGRIRNEMSTIRRPTGEVLLLRISAERIEISGEPCYLFIVEDVSEKMRMEEALKEGKRLFSEIFHLSPELAIITRKRDGRVIAVNDALLNACGFSREEVIGRTTIELGIWGGPEERQTLLSKFKEEGITRHCEIHLRRKSGERFPVMYSMVSVDYQGEECLFAVGIDITERKKAEEERERLEGLLRQSQKMEAVGTLAGGIAHDFNNILAGILGCTELAKLGAREDAKTLGYLDQIHKASLRARDLVKQILMFSRMSSSKEMEPVRLSFALRETLKFLRASIPTTIDIREHITSVSDLVLVDPSQMNQLLLNLATNAAHAMESSGGILELGLADVGLWPDSVLPHPDLGPGQYVMLSVSDTGCGMSADTLERIFEPYFTTKAAGKGTGLGLAIAHGVVKRHGGAITVESEVGRGTTFRVYIPKALQGEPEARAPEVLLPKGKERILLVDDEQHLAEVEASLLRELGYEVVAMSSPAEAVDLIRAEPFRFDLVITDYTMPGLTGADLAVRARETRPDLPIIMVTGFSERMTDEKVKELRLDAFFFKPFQQTELAQTIRRVLDSGKGA